jgi:RNA polymerase sigma-70 factor (ECF subfamily)
VTSTPPAVDPPDEVTARLRQGSREAMSQVFRSHLDVIYNYCYRRCGSWTVAEDLSSTVFLEVWRNRQRAVSVDDSVLPWIYGIATNVCRNHRRSQLRHSSAVTRLVDASAQPGDHGDDVARQVDDERRLRSALDRVQALPQADQDVFVLVCWEELSYQAVAAALQIPTGTVRSRLARVRRILRLADTAGNELGRVTDV